MKLSGGQQATLSKFLSEGWAQELRLVPLATLEQAAQGADLDADTWQVIDRGLRTWEELTRGLTQENE